MLILQDHQHNGGSGSILAYVSSIEASYNFLKHYKIKWGFQQVVQKESPKIQMGLWGVWDYIEIE